MKPISLDEILKTSDAPTKLALANLNTLVGDTFSAVPYMYQGAANVGPLATYDSRILYFSVNMYFLTSTHLGQGLIEVFDQANNSLGNLTNINGYYNGVGAAYVSNTIEANYLLFSRISPTNYDTVFFNGLRVVY